MEVPVLRPSVGLNPHWRLELQAELCRRALAFLLSLRVALTAPGDEGAAQTQQRSGVLGEDRKRSKRSGGHDIGAPETLGPRFDALTDDAGIRQFARHDGLLDKVALAPTALDERHRSVRESDRQRQAR